MSVSAQARASKIDKEAVSISKEVARANSTLAALFQRATNFTAFMNADPLTEFSQADRDKYTDAFNAALNSLNTTMAMLAPLNDLETDVVTVPEFLAAHTGTAPAAYSVQFDS